MKVKDVICAAGRSGYMHRDLLAIKAGKAKPNGSLYDGEPMSPGFTRIIEPATIISIMLVLEDGQVAVGDCVDVIFTGAAGRDALFQARQHYVIDQFRILSPKQGSLPRIYLEHAPPREHPTDTQPVVTDPTVTLVHCTNFNRLMWESYGVPTIVIDHGVVDPGLRYEGTLDRGIMVINNLYSRGRRLGLDVFEYIRQRVPLDLIGMGSDEIGGLGAVPHDKILDFMARYRFFFNPIRYTSLGLAIIEAMLVGLPIVGLATTELVSVITSGVSGYISLDPDELIGQMRALLDSPELARRLGENARICALNRFSIERFAREWQSLFRAVHS